MLAGSIAHDAIQRWFEQKRDEGATPEPAAFVEQAVEELRGHYRDSRDGRWQERPAKITHLAEHHYEEPQIDEATGEAGRYGKTYADRIRDSLVAFLEMPELEGVRTCDPSSWLSCEDMSTFDVEGVKVYAVPDFAYCDDDGVVHIWDWKTGSPRDADAFQLEVYAGYARDFWGADPDRVAPILRERVRLLCGSRDSYYLEGAVRRLAEALDELAPLADDAPPPSGCIEIVEGATHDSIVGHAMSRWLPEIRRLCGPVDPASDEPRP